MVDWRTVAIRLCGGLAVISLVAMMMVTVADVVLRTTINYPIRGVLEIVELALTCTFFLALPASFLHDEHIVVDIVGGRVLPLLRRIAAVIAIAVIAVLTWQGWKAAQDTLVFGDVTSDLALPRIYYWIPVLFGLAGSCLAAVAVAVRKRSDT